MKRILALMLVLLMLLPTVMSCSKDTNDGQDGSGTANTQKEGTENIYDEKGYLKDSLPELDYDDYEFKILAWDVYSTRGDFFMDVATGETIPDSIYKRNMKVQDRLNLSFQIDPMVGNYDAQDEFVAHVLNISMAGDVHEYDLIGSYSMVGGTLAMNNLTCDLYGLEHLDFEKPWWPQTYVERSELNGKLYFATGDLANSYLYMLHFMTVNVDILKSFEREDPRQMVKNGTWTIDKLIQMTKNVAGELDGVEGQGVDDRYAYAGYTGVEGDAWLAAAGINITEEDENGVLKLSEIFTGQITHDYLTKLNSWYWDSGECYTTYSKTPILRGSTMFGGVAGELMYQMNEKTNYTYGILPYPKLNEDQDNYYSVVGFAHTVFSIPNNSRDTAMSAAVLECMNSEAYRSSCPDLYEKVFKSRFVTDPIDAEMYDIIREGAYLDQARIFASSFGSVNAGPVGMFRSCVSGNKNTWMSIIGEKKDSINGTFKSISAFVGG